MIFRHMTDWDLWYFSFILQNQIMYIVKLSQPELINDDMYATHKSFHDANNNNWGPWDMLVLNGWGLGIWLEEEEN